MAQLKVRWIIMEICCKESQRYKKSELFCRCGARIDGRVKEEWQRMSKEILRDLLYELSCLLREALAWKCVFQN